MKQDTRTMNKSVGLVLLVVSLNPPGASEMQLEFQSNQKSVVMGSRCQGCRR